MFKVCDRCNLDIPLTEFWDAATTCKLCLDQMRRDQYNANRSRRNRAQRLVKDYNLSLDQYKIIYLAQEGKCAICQKQDTYQDRLVVDHDHESGEVRGLLCRVCNMGIGCLQDNPINLLNAAKYLLGDKKWL